MYKGFMSRFGASNATIVKTELGIQTVCKVVIVEVAINKVVSARAMRWMAAACAAGLLGCTEVEYPYLYISLKQVGGIQVDKTGSVGLKGLRGGVAVPLEYSLAREGYTLHFVLIQGSAHPAVRVSITGSDHSLQFQRDMNARAPNGVLCASYYPVNATSFDFGWEAGCTASQLTKAIEFAVLDSSGTVVAREHVVFTLHENGTFTATDVI